jgi:aryl-alcohol dehydrogenase-like predicted oxidoreductase
MPTVPLGPTGRRISRIGLGAMPLSTGCRPERPAALSVVRRAVELDVTFIDTADVYCLGDHEIGHNERLVAEALATTGLRDRVVVATKGGLTRHGESWGRDGRPEHLRRACDRSLAALGTDRIDLYQLHGPDPAVPLLESVGALAELQRAGKIAAIGLSNVTVRQLGEAQALVTVTSVQNVFNPWWARSWETRRMIAACARQAITFLPYSPLGGSRQVSALRASEPLRRIAASLQCSPEALVLAWILSRCPTLCAIPGASRIASIESSAGAATLELDAPTAAAVQRAFAALPGQATLGRRVLARLRSTARGPVDALRRRLRGRG